jgi:hypothetical protein
MHIVVAILLLPPFIALKNSVAIAASKAHRLFFVVIMLFYDFYHQFLLTILEHFLFGSVLFMLFTSSLP